MPDPWGGFNQGFNQLINVLQFKRQEERDKAKNLLATQKQKMEMAKMKREEETAKMQDAITYSRDMAGDGSPEDIAKFNARRSMWVQKWGEDPKLPKEYDPKYIAALKGLEAQKFEQIGAGGLYDVTSKKTISPVEKPGTPIVNWKTPEGKIKNLPQGVMPPEGSVQIDKEKPEKELKGKDKIINDLLESGRLTDQEKKMIAGAVQPDKSKTLDQRVENELTKELGRFPTDAEVLDRMASRQGQLAGTKAEATKNIYNIEAQKIGDAIMEGKQPPKVSGFGMSKIAPQIRSYLADQNYDLKTAELDYDGTKRYISTLNGNQQVRLKQAINFTYHSLDIIDELSNQWKGGRFPLLNKVNLKAAINGVYGQEAQIIATKIDTQIGDLVSELATVYKGGYASTDDSLKLAAKNLQSEWSQAQLEANVDLVRQNLKIRQNSINNVGVATFGGNAPTVKSGSTGREAEQKTTRFQLPDGGFVNIPNEEVDEFLKDEPKARRVK